MEVVDESNERFHGAELRRLKEELLLKEGSDEEAETSFIKAIALAQCQRARFPELRAVMSVSQLWQQQYRHNEARQMLAGIFNWFTEGFDTPALQDARTLLRALS